MVDPVASDQVVSLFQQSGQDGGRSLKIDELARGFNEVGIELTASQLRAVQKSCDFDNDGLVSLAEFKAAFDAHRVAVVVSFSRAW